MYSFVEQAFLLACVLLIHSSSGKVVLTKQGYIVGLEDIITHKSQKQTIYKFLGVPYAEKPIGNLRFKRPQSLKQNIPFGVYNATYFRPVCIQHLHLTNESIKLAWPGFTNEKGSNEDCLYLNIYTPKKILLTKKYPVIVYIHGGSFVVGTPVRDISPGEFMPTEGVILVTVQYRLGIFGFFSTGTPDAPGNVGLLDQVEALKWVQTNIEWFGGDPNSVTLLGESAGGASVTFLMLTPLSRGLFHRAIAISGVDFCPFAIKPKETVLELSKDIAKKVNCYADEPSKTLRCLKTVPVSLFLELNDGYPIFLTPFVDNYFLPNHPREMREKGLFQKLPLMTGFVSHEGSFILEPVQPKYSRQGFRGFLQDFAKQKYGDVSNFAVGALEFQYTPWTDLNDGEKFRKKLVEMLTDFFIAAPTHNLLTIHSDSGAPTYLFEFTHRSKVQKRPKWMGVIHGDTTAYKFGAPLLNKTMLNLFDDDDKNVSEILVHLFANFAKFGNPTPSPFRGIHWDVYNSSTKAYLKINKNPSMANQFHPARMAFWNYYFPRLIQRSPKVENPPAILGSRNNDDKLKISVGALLCLVFVSCMTI